MEKYKIIVSDVLDSVPMSASVVSLMTSGSVANADNVGIVADRQGELPPVVVLTAGSACGLTAAEEDAVVNAAIKKLPKYQAVKAKELPFPTSGATEEEWQRWDDSFRLGFFPLTMFIHHENCSNAEA